MRPPLRRGALLIAMAAAYRRHYPGHSYQQEVLFAAQDIDRTVALMCFVQLSLLGCAGYVVIGDSLRGPLRGSDLFPIPGDGYEIWYTPMCATSWSRGAGKSSEIGQASIIN